MTVHEVEEPHEGMRLDRYIAEVLELCSRSQIPQRVEQVTVNGESVKLSLKIKTGDLVEVETKPPEPSELVAESIPLDILYEDEHVVVVNKPAGMVVHPGAGNWSGTMANALLGHISGLEEAFDDELRPGIAHRLDKDTTGVIIAAKHPEALGWLSAQFQSRRTIKTYIAAVRGTPSHVSGTIDLPIGRDPKHRKRFAVRPHGGKSAITEYTLLYQGAHHSIVRLRPTTGRTHQLRVHMASLGTPILGDPIYGRSSKHFPDLPLMLHAYRLEIRLLHESERRAFTAALPETFTALLPDQLDLS
ncbi:MAG: RluA family pseudouridine synthase [Spirochaetales bacterium]